MHVSFNACIGDWSVSDLPYKFYIQILPIIIEEEEDNYPLDFHKS